MRESLPVWPSHTTSGGNVDPANPVRHLLLRATPTKRYAWRRVAIQSRPSRARSHNMPPYCFCKILAFEPQQLRATHGCFRTWRGCRTNATMHDADRPPSEHERRPRSRPMEECPTPSRMCNSSARTSPLRQGPAQTPLPESDPDAIFADPCRPHMPCPNRPLQAKAIGWIRAGGTSSNVKRMFGSCAGGQRFGESICSPCAHAPQALPTKP